MPLVRVVAVLLLLCLGAPSARAGSFEAHHPDQANRAMAFEAFEAGRQQRAFDYFRRAARYGDKPSQLALAMMYADGLGVNADPALAYAWSDLAAERGYVDFVGYREHLWEQLDAAQRERALAEGRKLYAEYGDEVAKPRLNRLLMQGLSQRTGSRTRSAISDVGVSRIDPAARAALTARMNTSYFLQGEGGDATTVNGRHLQILANMVGEVGSRTAVGYYDAENWQPKAYWRFQDQLWSPEGTVEVQALRVPKEPEAQQR